MKFLGKGFQSALIVVLIVSGSNADRFLYYDIPGNKKTLIQNYWDVQCRDVNDYERIVGNYWSLTQKKDIGFSYNYKNEYYGWQDFSGVPWDASAGCFPNGCGNYHDLMVGVINSSDGHTEGFEYYTCDLNYKISPQWNLISEWECDPNWVSWLNNLADVPSNSGAVFVGARSDNGHARSFLLTGHPSDLPQWSVSGGEVAFHTEAHGISSNFNWLAGRQKIIVGSFAYESEGLRDHGFIYTGWIDVHGNLIFNSGQQFDVPGAKETIIYDCSNEGDPARAGSIPNAPLYKDIAGTYVDWNNKNHGFLYSSSNWSGDNKQLSKIEFPAAVETQVFGMNPSENYVNRKLAGCYKDNQNITWGFVAEYFDESVPMGLHMKNSHTFQKKADGTLWTCGLNNHGQLGLGNVADTCLFTRVGTDTNWTSLAVGYYHTLALKSDSTLWAWGDNSHYQVGDCTMVAKTYPIQIGLGHKWIAVYAGAYHSMALTDSGSLFAWGLNNYGQCGCGPSIPEVPSPTKIGSDTDWASASLGQFHSLALKKNRTLWAWGSDSCGQLGDGRWSPGYIPPFQPYPEQIGTDTTWEVVFAGANYSTGINKDRTLWCWGGNESGQLGLGNHVSRGIPTRIDSCDYWLSVAPGFSHSLALKADGSAWAWGSNSHFELGTGDSLERTRPVRLDSSTGWKAVAAGYYSSMGVRSDTIWSCGLNNHGQLGSGDHLNRHFLGIAHFLPDAPELASPENNVSGQPTSIILRWQPGVDVSRYHVQMSLSRDFSSFVVDQNVTTDTLLITSLNSAAHYYWRVNATNSRGTSLWSAVWSFTTATVLQIGPNPSPIFFDGTFLWVGNSGSNTVTKLTTGGAIIGTYIVGRQPQGIAFDGTCIWVTSREDGTVTKLLQSSGAMVATYAAGTEPWGIVYDGTCMWITSIASNNVIKMNPANGAIVGTYAVGNLPSGILFDGTYIWVANANSNSVTKILASTGATAGTYPAGTSWPSGIAYDGTNIWVTNPNHDSVTVLLASTGAVVHAFPTTQSQPRDIVYDSNSSVWICNWIDGTVTRIDTKTGNIDPPVYAGQNTSHIVFDKRNIWVTNYYPNTVTRIDAQLPYPISAPASSIRTVALISVLICSIGCIALLKAKKKRLVT